MNRWLTLCAVAAVLAALAASDCPVRAGDAAPDEALRPVRFQQIRLGGFWCDQCKRLAEKWIPHCIEQMEPGGRGEELLNLVNTGKALRGESHGQFTGLPWSDAYVYNTVESICLALAVEPAGDEELAAAQDHLRAKLDEWIPIILAAQCEDGYIHSYHILNDRTRYTDINAHEFYVQGYFLEMGVAHYRITGGKDRRLYDAARRCADQLCETFGPTERVWIHGHAGMGYALCRLARLVNEVEGPGEGDKYFELVKFLLDTRHTVPEHRSEYRQSHKPVVEMREAVGHAVRATYFYTAMADLAMLTGDAAYRNAVDHIWSNAIDRKHYITGGVGASHQGEAFSVDFDLRNDGYCESCAGCGMTFWADRMHRMHHDAHYADVQERTLYNNLLGAIELSGENFFYQNPLASNQSRYPWHGCPCCVGNIPRALLAIKDLMYDLDRSGETLLVSHYVDSSGTIPDLAGTRVGIQQQTGYPISGEVTITLKPAEPREFTVKLRIPDRTESELYTADPDLTGKFTLAVNGETQTRPLEAGYVAVTRRWQEGDTIRLELPMEVQRVHCDERVVANRGRVALIRGPIVYNVEDVDHEESVRQLVLPADAELQAVWKPELLGGVMAIEGDALLQTDEGLRPTRLRAIPNYARLNRGGWSQVWIIEDPDSAVATGAPETFLHLETIDRPELDKRTIDRVVVGDPSSEREHKLEGEQTSAGVFQKRRWRHATGGGWFSYQMEIEPGAENAVLCTYWGSDVGNRRFSIVVDGEVIAAQTLQDNQPGEFFDVEYPIPTELTAGKERVTVRLQAEPGATAGGVFDLRIVQPE